MAITITKKTKIQFKYNIIVTAEQSSKNDLMLIIDFRSL